MSSHLTQDNKQKTIQNRNVTSEQSSKGISMTAVPVNQNKAEEHLDEKEVKQKKTIQAKSILQFENASDNKTQLKQKTPFQLQTTTSANKTEAQKTKPLQLKPNNTGLPDNLKTGVENLSGMDMSDVEVHYNSSQPAQLSALAYAQGNHIHIGPGQEKHLPHEAWHVVQQRQGRVQATKQMKMGVAINDDVSLESEADVMGEKALSNTVSGFFDKGSVQFYSTFSDNKTIQQAENSTKSLINSVVFQRVPVGTGAGTDNDRNNIQVENLVGNEQLNIRGDYSNRARITNDFVVGGLNRNGSILKHYMVVKNGSLYQFPIKHVFQPREQALNVFNPNPYNRLGRVLTSGNRGGQPEGFGGNTDLQNNQVQNNQNLTDLRNETLNHEYQEENHAHGGANLNITRAKKFGSAFGAGTLSIATTDQALVAGNNAHALANTANRGEAEMAGTVVIDCEALITGILVNDALEIAIGGLLQAARNQFYVNNVGSDPSNQRQQGNIFESNGGILAHLVGIVKEDIVAERARRHQVALDAFLAQQALAQQQLIAQQEAQHLREDEARQVREALKREQHQKLAIFLVVLGLGIFLAWLLK
jgi:Domain of unknown function (DUF4157)